MFRITMSQSYVAEGDSTPVPSYSRIFEGLSKRQVQHVEEHFLRDVFLEFGRASVAAGEGKGPKIGTTNAQTSTFSYRVEEDGVLWSAMQCIWPKWGREAQAMLDGAIAGITHKLPLVAAREDHKHGHRRRA